MKSAVGVGESEGRRGYGGGRAERGRTNHGPRLLDADGLNPRQAMFVQEYLVDLNATQAAIRAGYSPRWASRQAVYLMKLPTVSRVVAREKGERAEKLELTQEAVVVQLAQDHLFAQSVNQAMAAVKATELIGKHLGMFSDKVQHEFRDPALERLVKLLEGVTQGEARELLSVAARAMSSRHAVAMLSAPARDAEGAE